MPRRLLLQDACVLINLIASGRFEDIAQRCGYQLVIAAAACAEVLSIRDAVSGETVPVTLDPHFAAGLLERIDVETEEERAGYIAYAAQLDDGEAMSLALAEVRHLPLATDDRKARSLVVREGIRVELFSTVAVLQAWEQNAGISIHEMREVLTRIRKSARFYPAVGTPESGWWESRCAIQ
jgi:predicted nucleic acid-binding protein